MEPELTSLGPAADALDPSETREATPKPTEAWRDDSTTDAAAKPGQVASAPRPARRQPAYRRRQWRQRAAVAFVALQALWAVAIPIKNVAVTLHPSTRPDEASLSSHPYSFNASDAPVAFPGRDLLPLLRTVARATLGRQPVRLELERAGTFDLTRVNPLLPLADFAAVSQLYALELQSATFPGAAFTPRPIPQDAESPLVTLVLTEAAASTATRVEIQLACSTTKAVLPAVRCTQLANGEPCPEGALETSDDGTQAVNSTLYTLTDVDLLSAATKNASALSGLRNNVGLLYVVEFFSQAMSALVAARDWTSALEDLSFSQSAADALPSASTSAFTTASDGQSAPLLLAADAFLLGVRAGLLQTSVLDSCVASELTVALFYSRALVLHEIRCVLLELDLYDVRGGPSVLLPSNVDAVLAPLWRSSLSITSGARASQVQRTHTSFFGSLVRVATRESAHASFKADRRLGSSSQVIGSSLRMVQHLSFFPGLLSAFSYGTRQLQTSNSDGSETEYDFQTYALLGAAGAGVNSFQEAVAGAGSAMIFPLAELPDADSVSIATDAAWDAEARLASWFRSLEADEETAPFRVFDDHLAIASAAPAAVTDDDADSRCHRALFKALAKLTYLALLAASKPASFLMFMGDVAEGQRAWLLRAADRDELTGESLFGAGDRVGIPFRSGSFTRKDDGSAWVAVPLLDAMLDAFGRDEVLSRLAVELDESFKVFVAGSGGGLLHFPDARYCQVSGVGTAADGSSLVVDPADSLDEIYAKISSGLVASLDALLDDIPALATAMYAAVPDVASQSPLISRQQLLGSSIVGVETQLRGPPATDWRFSAVTAGLRRLWPPRTPPSTTVAEFRSATRCYRVLELRSLSVTTQCLLEPHNTRAQWQTLSAEPLRVFFLGLWSVALLLNTLALVVVAKYLRKLRRAREATHGFARLDLQVARQLGLQATGVLKLSQSLLLLAASVPLVLALHVPDDAYLMPRLAEMKPSKAAVDVLVVLSMSWVWKVGFEVSNDWLQPWSSSSRWLVGATYWQHDAIARLKWGSLLVVLVARLLTSDGGEDGAYRGRKLAATVCSSLALGVCSSAAVAFWRPGASWRCLRGHRAPQGKVVDDPTASESGEKDEQDAVIAALVQQKLPLHRYGVLGRTARGGWSKAALIVEGWRLARRASDGREVLRKGAGEIVLPSAPLLARGGEDGEGGDEDEECEVFSRSDVVPVESRKASAVTTG